MFAFIASSVARPFNSNAGTFRKSAGTGNTDFAIPLTNSGTMTADVLVRGTWDEPRLGGTVRIHNGRAAVPPPRARFHPFAVIVTSTVSDAPYWISMSCIGKR